MNTFLKHLIFSTALFILLVSKAEAATLSLSSVKQNEAVAIDVSLDPEGESINSLDISIAFPRERYSFSGYVEEKGTIPIWIATPSEISPGTIQFAGVIPGGLDRMYDPTRPDARAVKMVRLLFTPTSTGDATFSISEALVLRNDGSGSAVAVTKQSVSVKTPAVVAATEEGDTEPPTPFVISIIEGSLFGKTPRLAVFATTDEGSGIERYEISHGQKFVVGESPYALPRRFFPYTLTVKAVDFSGNEQRAQISVRGVDTPVAIFIIALVAAAVIVVYTSRARRKTHSNEVPS